MTTRVGITTPQLALRPKQSRVRRLLHLARQKPVGAVSLLVILALIAMAAFADAIAPYGKTAMVGVAFTEPFSPGHFLGTDHLGRDVWTRTIYGSRISIWVGLVAVFTGVLSGSVLGIISGYFGGKLDLILQRVLDAVMSLPALVLALTIVSVLGASTTNALIAIAVVLAPSVARIIRGQVLSVKEFQYVEAARALGASTPRILLQHITPNVFFYVVILISVDLGAAIIIEASLSFLGLGTQPPTPSWGYMLSNEGRKYLTLAPWIALAPGVAISVVVLAFNMLGDTIRDILDPRLRGT